MPPPRYARRAVAPQIPASIRAATHCSLHSARRSFRSLRHHCLPTTSSGRAIGSIPASGIIFKDIVRVDRIDDPKVKGVELYVSQFERPLVDRLAGDFGRSSASGAVTCVRVGPMELAENIDASELGEEVFSQSRNLLLKSVNVRRLYDRERGVIVYVSYSTRSTRATTRTSRASRRQCARSRSSRRRPTSERRRRPHRRLLHRRRRRPRRRQQRRRRQ